VSEISEQGMSMQEEPPPEGKPRFKTFDVVNVDGFHLQGKTQEGEIREFGLQVVMDKITGEMALVPYRHFVDPESLPWFPGSVAWDS
jgi:hypothetical protein